MRLYTPHLMRIDGIRSETPDVKTFKLRFLDPEIQERFRFRANILHYFKRDTFGQINNPGIIVT